MNIYYQELKHHHDTLALGQKLAMSLKHPCLIFLYGSLGMGKTSLAQGFIRSKTNDINVLSPTFTYVNTYNNEEPIYHFDLYRAQGLDEIINLGLMDLLLDDHAFRLVEWPEKLVYHVTPDIVIEFSEYNEGRMTKISTAMKDLILS